MSEDNTPGSENDEGPKALREALEKANKELAALRKEREDAEKAKRDESLATILKSKGLKESAAAHYTGEASEDAVVKWATDIGLLSAEEENDENAEAARRAAAVSGSSASQPGGSPNPNGPIVGDPHKMLEMLSTPGFSYEDGVRLGLFPKDPNTI